MPQGTFGRVARELDDSHTKDTTLLAAQNEGDAAGFSHGAVKRTQAIW
jgi:hypothetical protein